VTDTLQQWSTERLMREAQRRRARRTGRLITFSRKAFFPLTMLCRDRCGYCTFAKVPARLPHCYLQPDELEALAARAAAVDATEALFTLGERPELRYRRAAEELQALGERTTLGYLSRAAEIALAHHLLPHLNPGTMDAEEMVQLRGVAVSMGLMLESTSPHLAAHRGAPDKDPGRRVATLETAGRLRIPMTSGILVGIGETEKDRIESLQTLARIANDFGTLQEVIVQNFLPKPRTAMAHHSPCPLEDHVRAIALARIILPDEVHVQAPPNLAHVADLLEAGIDDLGGISELTIDHVNPERPWPTLPFLERTLAEHGYDLIPRLPVYPEFITDEFLAPELRPAVRYHADQLGYAREQRWFSGVPSEVPPLPPRRARYQRPGWLEELTGELDAGRHAPAEHLRLALASKGSDTLAVLALADELRRRAVGDQVTYVVNRNINYTNICTFRCRFCAFSKGPLSLNLRGQPYLLDIDTILAKVGDARARGATEVCLQGGIHPSFDGAYYLEVVHQIHQAFPDIHVHAFSALEVLTGARRLGMDLESYLRALHDAGLKSLPGTAAEILEDRVRRELCPDKLSSGEWLEVHETAHQVGLRSNITIMFGSLERVEDIVSHLVRTRALACRTGGFTEFVPLPFVHMATPIFLAGKARRGPTFREAALIHAVGRIAYFGVIDHIQASWVKLGPDGARQLLAWGCDDLGGTLMEESISHAAGATHGTALEHQDFEAIATAAGRRLSQRTTFYELVPPRDRALEVHAG
jgi:7,8-didemethyl-8-hydroxy-5-deazariboflavin synthase CofH subunit/7,8-didemethyl-8-hydroxy-5-deazariboflavin synthase CofG subunit